MGYKDGMYWGSNEDELIRILLTTDNNTKDWLLTYKKVLPRLKRMGVTVLRRYYWVVNDMKANDLITDAIATILIKGKYNPDKPKMFAYLGTIMKRFFYDELVLAPNRKSNILDDKYDITDNTWVDNNYYEQPSFDEFDLDERQELFNELMILIKNGLNECKLVVKRRTDNVIRNGKLREHLFLTLSQEYFNKYFMTSSVGAQSLSDYIQANSEIPETIVSRYMIKYFNVGAQPQRIDEKIKRVDWCDRKGISYVLDDYTPNDGYKKKIRNKLSGYEYF